MVSCTFFRQFISLDSRFPEKKKSYATTTTPNSADINSVYKILHQANILSISKRLGPVFLRLFEGALVTYLRIFFSVIVAKRHQYVRNNLIKLKIIWKIFIKKKVRCPKVMCARTRSY